MTESSASGAVLTGVKRILLRLSLIGILMGALFGAVLHPPLAQAESKENLVETSDNDDRLYRYVLLSNQMKVLLISDPGTDKAAVSLDVNIGSGDDPEDRPGLAHFLEHMLFLGTEKYPHAGEYQQFIDSHGGSHNAYTSLEHTNYFFDIAPEYLEKGLDRFAQFFLSPLMDAEYVDRERNAVHSEFMARIQNENRRRWDVYSEIFNPKNKTATFSVGNKETLGDREDDKVRDDLLAFYNEYYSSNLMSLVILGGQSLDELEKLVRKYFAAVENKDVKLSYKKVPLFVEGDLPKKLYVEPFKEKRELSLSFPIPPFEHLYMEKPVEYIAHLLGHEGKGSLFEVWKNRGWVETLAAGPSITNRQSASFSVSMALTEEGFEKQDEMISEFFYMVQLIKDKGVDKWRYNEQSVISETFFRYQEKGDALHYVSTLSNHMHYYPARELIRGAVLLQRYNRHLIERYLDYLTPANMLVEVMAPEVPTDKSSAYYSAAYALHDLNEDDLSRWNAPASAGQELLLPTPNEFVAKNFKLKHRSQHATGAPELIRSTENMRLWYGQDDKFMVPRSSINLYARSVHSVAGIEGAVLTDIFVRLLNRQVNSFRYSATLAGLDLKMEPGARGANIAITGFSDKQGLLLKRTLEAMAAPLLTQQDLDKVKEELLRTLQNQKQQAPYMQLFGEWLALLSKTKYDRETYRQAVSEVTLKDVQAFSQKWLHSLNVDVLIHGNVTQSDSLKLAAIIENELLLGGTGHKDPKGIYVKLPDSDQGYIYPFAVDHPDVATLYYVQANADEVVDQAKMSLLGQLMEAEFFHQLRTEQQLGYIVSGRYLPLARVPGIGFMVQSPTHSMVQIDQSINTFLGDFAKTLVSMKPDQFEQHRSALLHRWKEQPKSLVEQTGRWWEDITYGYRNFDHLDQLAAALPEITQEDLADYYWKNFLAPEKRKLVVVAQPQERKLNEKWISQMRLIEDVENFKADKDYYYLK